MASGSVVPVISVPSGLISAVGASGAVKSGATILVESEVFPALSVKVASISSPSTCGGTKSTSNSPFSLTIPSPMIVPFGSVISTLAPGSPLPVTLLPSSLITKPVGASGAVISIEGLLSLLLLSLSLLPRAEPINPTPARPTSHGNASKLSASVAPTHQGVAWAFPPSA